MDEIKEEGVSNVTFFVWRHRGVRWTQAERNGFSQKEQSIRPSRSEPDLFLRGDVQVLEARIEQEVLVDLVSRDVARHSAVHLRMSRQMNLQHLQEHGKCIRAHLNPTHPSSAVVDTFCFSVQNEKKMIIHSLHVVSRGDVMLFLGLSDESSKHKC